MADQGNSLKAVALITRINAEMADQGNSLKAVALIRVKSRPLPPTGRARTNAGGEIAS